MDAALLTERLKISLFEKSKEDKLSEIMAVYIKPTVTGSSSAVYFRIQLTDEPDGKGALLEGNVEISMMPDGKEVGDPDYTIPIRVGKEDKFVVHVENGLWENGPYDFSAYEALDLSRFLFTHDEAYQIVQMPLKPVPISVGTPAQRQDSKQQALTLELNNFDVVKGDKTCEVVVRGILIRGNVVVVGQRMDFFREGKIETVCQTDPGVVTDENGRFEYTYKNQPLAGKRVRYEVQVRGGLRRHLDIDIPAAPEKKPEVAPVYAIDADLEYPHPQHGKFIVSGNCTLNGKPGNFELSIYSASGKAKVEARLGKIEPGLTRNTFKLAPVAGKFLLAVVIKGSQDELFISAPDGTVGNVPMVKPA